MSNMLLKFSPFELDRESMILRNNKLLKHYNQLNLIKNRKNLFLPKISSPNRCKIFSPKKRIIKNNIFKNIVQSKIDKENEKMNNKINEITNRPMKKVLTEQQIFYNILKLNKKSRNKIRKQNMDLLVKSNIEMQKRIDNVHPVINHHELNKDYLKSRKIYKLNQKLKPCFSQGNNCLTRDDYSIIEKSKDSTSSDIKLKKIKLKKLGVGVSKKN
jgi:hypothetical protein